MSTADEAWQEFNSSPSGEPRYGHSEQAAFMAGYRRALEDAVSAAHRDESLWDEGFPVWEKWLRDRAAGVGTKDGDDDE